MEATNFRLDNGTYLITGATGGIGGEIARQIAIMGGKCVLQGRQADKLQVLSDELPGTGHTVSACDLTDSDQRSAFVSGLPQLDGIVHAAGVVQPFPIKFLTAEKLAETMDINYQAPTLLTAALLKTKKFNNGASHVFLSSISGDHPHKGGSAYAGSKAALQAFAKTLALETAHLEMRANCVSPAMVKTAMYEVAEKGMSKESMDEHIASYPLGVGYPKDVAGAVIFLLSDASRWITGINLTLDGGFLLAAK